MADSEQNLFDIIESHSGLHVKGTHRECVRAYVTKRLGELNMTLEHYCIYLETKPGELAQLINEATINETYFFREERQFEFLQNTLFPEMQGRHVIIWSAACATGEEPVSLALLAADCGLDADVYASDIDTSALETLRTGGYSTGSFRPDGSKFHNLLLQNGRRNNGSYTVNSTILSRVHISSYNLAGTDAPFLPDESVDLVFVRNVFIYFNQETRNRIIARLAGTIKTGGCLFFSMNEIAGVEVDDPDIPLVKEHCGQVYYFRKVDPSESRARKSGRVPQPLVPAVIRAKREVLPAAAHAEKEVFPAVKKSRSVPEPGLADRYGRMSPESIESCGEQLMNALDKHDVRTARALLAGFTCSPSQLEYQLYYTALILKEEGRPAEAADMFLKAALLNPEFWPAQLQLGLLYEERGEEKNAVKAFSECAQVLERYISADESCYNFLVESFSPSYFYTLCTIYIKKGNNHAV